ncbi:MAG: 4Fe-4S dicluster domain-containing protein [archaeon]|nr:4Fe-4S dicluster domain-containing protein [archaeon]
MVVDIVRPFFLGLYHAFKRTFTIKHPFVRLKPTDMYRVIVMLNINRFIRCISCVNICPNKALEMVDLKWKKVPQYDAGRCCLCNLCVEVCPTIALSMSYEVDFSEYTRKDMIHTPDRFSQPPKPIAEKTVTVKIIDKKFGVAHR